MTMGDRIDVLRDVLVDAGSHVIVGIRPEDMTASEGGFSLAGAHAPNSWRTLRRLPLGSAP